MSDDSGALIETRRVTGHRVISAFSRRLAAAPSRQPKFRLPRPILPRST